jgi:membrane-bound serine protease (ClpP class)
VIELFYILLITGLLLTGGEIFVPGGILGVIGICSLIGAMIVSNFAFPTFGPYISIGLIFLLLVSIFLWAKYFPKTRFGRQMTLVSDGSNFDATEPNLAHLLNQEGKTLTRCRPAGFASIGGRKVDVVTEGAMLGKDQTIRVVQIEGNRIVVRKV